MITLKVKSTVIQPPKVVELGRPNLLKLLPAMIENATGSLCSVTCGPPGMNPDVRNTVSSNLMKSKYYVDCFEEGFEMRTNSTLTPN